VLAQRTNKHGVFCGTSYLPCKQCDVVAAHLRLEGLAALRERLGCELSWRTEEAEYEAADYASDYFTLIRPGRAGDLWTKPVSLKEIADIGDLVQAEAEREIMNSMPKPKGR
jgi:hypothetical protein